MWDVSHTHKLNTHSCCVHRVGDIGTSPLYVYSTIFDSSQPSQEDVLCATSLIFWSITLVVMVKYVFIVLQADDNGEGMCGDLSTPHECSCRRVLDRKH